MKAIAQSVLGMLVLGLASIAHAAPTTRPNVLFIVADDLTTTALGCYGNTVCHTPNIDRLASMGVQFKRAYCQWPLCLPSRNSFLSGRRPTATFTGDGLLRTRVPDVEFIPEHFRKAGYFTARYGKMFHTRTVFQGIPIKTLEDPACWDISEIGGTAIDPDGYNVLFAASFPRSLPAHPELKKIIVDQELLHTAGQPAFDYWMEYAMLDVPDEQCVDGNIAVQSIKFLDEHAKLPQSFFLGTGFRRPHLLWCVPKKYFDMYDYKTMKLAEQVPNDLDDIPKVALTRRAPDMTTEQRQKAIAAYYACVTEVDDNLGKLMATMDRLKLWDNTIVVFTSDHGWHLGEHDSLWGKVTLFEEAAKVPLIIVAPGMSKGVSPRTVEMLDFYPTLCELAGLPMPNVPTDGTSMVPKLRDPQAPRDRPAYSIVRHGKTFGRAVYTEQFRYTEWGDNASQGVELYDHNADPKEYTNLAHDPAQADTVKRLKTLLDATVHVSDKDTNRVGSKD